MVKIFVLLTVIALVGCAPPSTIKPERTAEIKKVGVVTEIPKDELLVLDHTDTMSKSYTYGQFGALGALIETGILMGVREYRTSKSINGDTNKVRAFIAGSSLKPSIDFSINEKLSKKYAIVEPKFFEGKALSIRKTDECLMESKRLGIDTLVFLEIAYGLAAYNDKPASVSIDGAMTVYDVNSGKIILKKNIESDQDFREHRSIEELSKEDGKLIKEDFNGAVIGFASYVARQLGVWQ